MIRVIFKICLKRFIDLSTGRHLQHIHVDMLDYHYQGTVAKSSVITNTNFIVVITSNLEYESTMNVYDREAMRNQLSTLQEILCTSVKVGQIIL